MLVKFKQAVHLKGLDGKGKDYPRGVHEVPEDHLEAKHFHNLIKAGFVECGEPDVLLTPQQRQDMLLEKLSAAPHHPVNPAAVPAGDGGSGDKDALPSSSPGPLPAESEPEVESKGPEPKKSKKQKR